MTTHRALFSPAWRSRVDVGTVGTVEGSATVWTVGTVEAVEAVEADRRKKVDTAEVAQAPVAARRTGDARWMGEANDALRGAGVSGSSGASGAARFGALFLDVAHEAHKGRRGVQRHLF